MTCHIRLLLVVIGALVDSVVEGHDLVHSFYWAVVTMATVGYGSGGPQSDGARLFCTAFMIVGVSCMGNLVGELSARPLRLHKRKMEERVLRQYGDSLVAAELAELQSAETLKQLDLCRHAPASGGITRDAFCLVMLLRTEKVDIGDLRRCQAAFDTLDADGSGVLDMDDVIDRSSPLPRTAAA